MLKIKHRLPLEVDAFFCARFGTRFIVIELGNVLSGKQTKVVWCAFLLLAVGSCVRGQHLFSGGRINSYMNTSSGLKQSYTDQAFAAKPC